MAKNHFLTVLADFTIHRYFKVCLQGCALQWKPQRSLTPGSLPDSRVLCDAIFPSCVLQFLTLTTLWLACQSSAEEEPLNSFGTV